MIMVESDGAVISPDRQRLEYALGNLLDNALAHGAGDLELISKRDGDVVELQVRDHGTGSPTATWRTHSSASLQQRAPDAAPV
jgi:signal transduction histidine kinase